MLNKILIYRLYMELLQINKEKTDNPIGEWRKDINRPLTENRYKVTTYKENIHCY